MLPKILKLNSISGLRKAIFKTKIYDRFTQVDSSVTRKKGGTGLGLSITQQLVNDMNGKIDFTSKNGKTVFFVEFNKVV